MRRREITICGEIDQSGNIKIYMDELKQFMKNFKGEKLIATFKAIPKKDKSILLRSYYMNYIVPTFREAIREAGERLTLKDVDLRLSKISPIMIDETPDPKNGEYFSRVKEIVELNNVEFVEFIETLQQYGAENYSIYIEDPK